MTRYRQPSLVIRNRFTLCWDHLEALCRSPQEQVKSWMHNGLIDQLKYFTLGLKTTKSAVEEPLFRHSNIPGKVWHCVKKHRLPAAGLQ